MTAHAPAPFNRQARFLFSNPERFIYVISRSFGNKPRKIQFLQTEIKYSVKMTIVNGSLSAYTYLELFFYNPLIFRRYS